MKGVDRAVEKDSGSELRLEVVVAEHINAIAIYEQSLTALRLGIASKDPQTMIELLNLLVAIKSSKGEFEEQIQQISEWRSRATLLTRLGLQRPSKVEIEPDITSERTIVSDGEKADIRRAIEMEIAKIVERRSLDANEAIGVSDDEDEFFESRDHAVELGDIETASSIITFTEDMVREVRYEAVEDSWQGAFQFALASGVNYSTTLVQAVSQAIELREIDFIDAILESPIIGQLQRMPSGFLPLLYNQPRFSTFVRDCIENKTAVIANEDLQQLIEKAIIIDDQESLSLLLANQSFRGDFDRILLLLSKQLSISQNYLALVTMTNRDFTGYSPENEDLHSRRKQYYGALIAAIADSPGKLSRDAYLAMLRRAISSVDMGMIAILIKPANLQYYKFPTLFVTEELIAMRNRIKDSYLDFEMQKLSKSDASEGFSSILTQFLTAKQVAPQEDLSEFNEAIAGAKIQRIAAIEEVLKQVVVENASDDYGEILSDSFHQYQQADKFLRMMKSSSESIPERMKGLYRDSLQRNKDTLMALLERPELLVGHSDKLNEIMHSAITNELTDLVEIFANKRMDRMDFDVSILREILDHLAINEIFITGSEYAQYLASQNPETAVQLAEFTHKKEFNIALKHLLQTGLEKLDATDQSQCRLYAEMLKASIATRSSELVEMLLSSSKISSMATGCLSGEYDLMFELLDSASDGELFSRLKSVGAFGDLYVSQERIKFEKQAIIAVREADVNKIKELVVRGVDLSAIQVNKGSLLKLLMQYSELELTELRKEKGEWSESFRSLSERKLSVLKMLLKYGNYSQNEIQEAFELCIDQALRVNSRIGEDEGKIKEVDVVLRGDHQLIRELLSSGANPSDQPKTTMMLSIIWRDLGWMAVVKFVKDLIFISNFAAIPGFTAVNDKIVGFAFMLKGGVKAYRERIGENWYHRNINQKFAQDNFLDMNEILMVGCYQVNFFGVVTSASDLGKKLKSSAIFTNASGAIYSAAQLSATNKDKHHIYAKQLIGRYKALKNELTKVDSLLFKWPGKRGALEQLLREIEEFDANLSYGQDFGDAFNRELSMAFSESNVDGTYSSIYSSYEKRSVFFSLHHMVDCGALKVDIATRTRMDTIYSNLQKSKAPNALAVDDNKSFERLQQQFVECSINGVSFKDLARFKRFEKLHCNEVEEPETFLTQLLQFISRDNLVALYNQSISKVAKAVKVDDRSAHYYAGKIANIGGAVIVGASEYLVYTYAVSPIGTMVVTALAATFAGAAAIATVSFAGIAVSGFISACALSAGSYISPMLFMEVAPGLSIAATALYTVVAAGSVAAASAAYMHRDEIASRATSLFKAMEIDRMLSGPTNLGV